MTRCDELSLAHSRIDQTLVDSRRIASQFDCRAYLLSALQRTIGLVAAETEGEPSTPIAEQPTPDAEVRTTLDALAALSVDDPDGDASYANTYLPAR